MAARRAVSSASERTAANISPSAGSLWHGSAARSWRRTRTPVCFVTRGTLSLLCTACCDAFRRHKAPLLVLALAERKKKILENFQVQAHRSNHSTGAWAAQRSAGQGRAGRRAAPGELWAPQASFGRGAGPRRAPAAAPGAHGWPPPGPAGAASGLQRGPARAGRRACAGYAGIIRHRHSLPGPLSLAMHGRGAGASQGGSFQCDANTRRLLLHCNNARQTLARTAFCVSRCFVKLTLI